MNAPLPSSGMRSCLHMRTSRVTLDILLCRFNGGPGSLLYAYPRLRCPWTARPMHAC